MGQAQSSSFKTGQWRSDGARLPGVTNGRIVRGNKRPRLKPRIEVAPKRIMEGCFGDWTADELTVVASRVIECMLVVADIGFMPVVFLLIYLD